MSALDLVHRLPINARRVLHVGYVNEKFENLLLQRQPSCLFVNVPVVEVITSVETFIKNKGSYSWDVVVIDDVPNDLDHLQKILHVTKYLLANDGVCISKFNNLGNWRVLADLLRGSWNESEEPRRIGRLLSLSNFAGILEKEDFSLLDVIPITDVNSTEESKTIIQSLLNTSELLKGPVQRMQVELLANAWVVRSKPNGQISKKPNSNSVPLCIAALSMKKFAGVTEPRVDFPLAALRTVPNVRATWSEGSLSIPSDYSPGIIFLHRQFMNDEKFNQGLEQKIKEGWILVSDIDDDPHHWKEFIDSDFFAYRAVHAVTVSCNELAEMVKQWNPNVAVFNNAMYTLPLLENQHRLIDGRLVTRIFYGALNRKADWQFILPGVLNAIKNLGEKIEFVIVHDKDFYDALPADCKKTFLPTLSQDRYMHTLGQCDVALLPLNDNQFNRCKSDIKLIECASVGTAVICSTTVYGKDNRHKEFALFADTPDQWADSIVKLCNDKKLRSDHVINAYNYVRSEGMHCQQVDLRLAFYRSLVNNKNELELQRQKRMASLK